MKKILLTCVAVLSLQLVSYSQSFRLGLRAGVNIASISGDLSAVANKSNVTGLQAALLGELKFGAISIVPELAYSQQGVNIESNNFTVNNLNIPVLLRLSLGVKVIRLFVNTGPQFSLKLSDKDITAGNIKLSSVNTSDFGWAFGGGVGLKLGHGELFVDARYTLGLISSVNITVNPNSSNPITLSDSKNGVIGISVGYAYKFGL